MLYEPARKLTTQKVWEQPCKKIKPAAQIAARRNIFSLDGAIYVMNS